MRARALASTSCSWSRTSRGRTRSGSRSRASSRAEARMSAPTRRVGFRIAAVALSLLATSTAGALDLQPPRLTREQMEAALADAPPFRFVYGTRAPAAAATLRARALLLARRAFGGDSSQVVGDRDAPESLLAAGPVFLLGGPDENEWTRRLA